MPRLPHREVSLATLDPRTTPFLSLRETASLGLAPDTNYDALRRRVQEGTVAGFLLKGQHVIPTAIIFKVIETGDLSMLLLDLPPVDKPIAKNPAPVAEAVG